MAWFEPRPGKGVDWEAKWKADGRSMARDRIRVQRWRRQNRLEQYEVSVEKEEMTQVLGHGPGQGCDFCDNLRLEGADGFKEEEEEEEDEEEEWKRTSRDDLDSIAETAETLFEGEEEGVSMDDSQTLRAIEEERIIDQYLMTSPSSSRFSSSSSPHNHDHNHNQGGYSSSRRRRDEREKEEGGEERKKRASQWARSYTRLLDGE